MLEGTKRFFAHQNASRGRGGSDGKVLGPGQLVVAGALAGVANGVVSGPVEHIRIREHHPGHHTQVQEILTDSPSAPLQDYRPNRLPIQHTMDHLTLSGKFREATE